MSEKLPALSWREVVRALGKAGFRIVHQRGSHLYLTDGKHKITVPRHDTIERYFAFNNTSSGFNERGVPKAVKGLRLIR